ncbi:hypothetical protein QWY85_07635 [Neolewinella lacunae]|uniref:Fibronectin type-III domain-containing protein n=1 Tax=Neolewinella lacunae TaxID=1517758 RepID=A0A923PIE9_9BACT|nr:hypothetical protein [Neolewinella lacunae]MBC6994650.1 hypothetical protein [Neolewinella lacunae]MDN3634522.1 hypothetical protein [Neolewinella lacunae]
MGTVLRMTMAIALLLAGTGALWAQATANASASSGGGYATLAAAQFGVEGPDNSSPDCVSPGTGSHQSFGQHILQVADAELDQNVFAFVSHIDEDNDRCVVFDRARIEIKGGPQGSTDPELEHAYGDETFYRWQFQLPADFVGASSFCHLFQNKAQGGSDSDFPILTITARASIVELRHHAGDENPAGTQGSLVSAPLSDFRGRWVEVYLRQEHRNDGALTFTVNDVLTGASIISYANPNIDLFRGAPTSNNVINRPKWGIYRAYNATANPPLKDEIVRFANFCSSEVAASLCPSLLPDLGLPDTVRLALPLEGSANVPLYMPLVWEPSAGATSYNVYLGTTPTPGLVANVTAATFSPTLVAGTTYYYQVGAVSSSGERRNTVATFSTLVNPDDGDWDVARGHARPEVEHSSVFSFDFNVAGDAAIDSTSRIPSELGNNQHCHLSDQGTTGNYRWRYRQMTDDEVTVLLRLAPIPANNNITYVEFYGRGWRQKLRINRSNIQLQQTPGDPTFDFPEGFWDNDPYRIIRITFGSNPTPGGPLFTRVYLEESPTVFASGESETTSGATSARIDIGRSGGDDYGACFDYLAINPTGAYPPDAGTAFAPPADLNLAPLPVRWSGPLTVATVGKERELRWAVAEQVNNEFFTVESSTDGRRFVALANISADGNFRGERQYTYRDARILGGTIYYRIRQTDYSGDYTFSNTVAVTAAGRREGLSVRPNPVTDALQLRGVPTDGTYRYRILSLGGRELQAGTVGQSLLPIRALHLPAGPYLLQTTAPDGRVETVRFIKR